MNKLEDLQNKMLVVEQIRNDLTSLNKYRKDKDHDKIGIGFNIDARYKACVETPVWLSSWKGKYGSSSCSRIFYISDAALFTKHLIKVLNNDVEKILTDVAKSIEDEAKESISEAKEILKEQLAKIEEMER